MLCLNSNPLIPNGAHTWSVSNTMYQLPSSTFARAMAIPMNVCADCIVCVVNMHS